MNSVRYIRLVKEGSWIAVGQGAAVLASLALVRLLTGRLSPAQYGQLALALTVAGLANQVVTGGITSAIARFYSIATGAKDARGYFTACRHLMTYAALAVLVLGFAVAGALMLFHLEEWLGVTAGVVVFSLVSGCNAALSGIQNAARHRASVALHNGLEAGLRIFVVLAALSMFGSSSAAVVIGYAVASVVVMASQFLYVHKLLDEDGGSNTDGSDWKEQMWRYSWPIAIGGLFNWGYYASQRWALQLFGTTEDVGKFYALTQISYAPISMAGAMFLSFLTPILFSIAGDATNREQLRTTYSLVIRIGTVGLALTVLVSVLTYFAKEPVFAAMVSPEYRAVAVYMPYVSFAAGVLQVSLAISSALMTTNETRKLLPLSLIGNSTIALINLWFTRQWGFGGLVAAMVIGATLHLSWMIVLVSRDAPGTTTHG